jgi:hypothetical protein
MDTKDLVIDYNQHFITQLKIIPHASKPVEDVTVEFYTSGFPIYLAMHVNNTEKCTPEEPFQEALKFEKKLLIFKGNLGSKPSQYKGKSKENSSKPLE